MDAFSQWLHPDMEGPVDNQVLSEYLSPALINAGGPYISRPGDSDNVRKMNFVHAVTPETAHSTHYFLATARNFRLDDDELSRGLSESMHRVAREDVDALEKIEPLVDQFANTKKELSCLGDAGAIRVRRKTQISSEQAKG